MAGATGNPTGPKAVAGDPPQKGQDAQSKDTFEELKAAIQEAIDNLTHLDVKTVVGKVAEPDPSILESMGIKEVENAKLLSSRINIVLGDITSFIDERFIPEGELPKIREFHEKRVEEGSAIIERNIKALKELLSLAKQYLR
ncbi:MAG: hypothetical protein AAF495_09805 [Pseudomonadota bacterium]